MAYGQLDPARLQGEALRRWYLRTPLQIEAEREVANEQAYRSFFSQPGSRSRSDFDNSAVPSPDDPKTAKTQAAARLDHNHSAARDEPLLRNTAAGRAYVQAAATSRGFWDYWSPRGCANCHGYTPDTLPPIGGQSPFPPNYSPRSGGAGGHGGSQPDRRDKKECDMQRESDSQICGRLPKPRDVAICRGTASERYAHCLKSDGTIGFPRLETKGGRRR